MPRSVAHSTQFVNKNTVCPYFLDVLAGYVRHVHLKDWVKSDKPDIADVSGAPLGAGIIPNAELVRRLVRDHGVTSFSLEVGAPGEKLAAAQHDLETVRAWLRGA